MIRTSFSDTLQKASPERCGGGGGGGEGVGGYGEGNREGGRGDGEGMQRREEGQDGVWWTGRRVLGRNTHVVSTISLAEAVGCEVVCILRLGEHLRVKKGRDLDRREKDKWKGGGLSGAAVKGAAVPLHTRL